MALAVSPEAVAESRRLGGVAAGKATEGPYDPTFAYAPGLFVVGSSKAALAPVVRRFLGEEKETLRGTHGFRAAAAGYRKPGLFCYANAPLLFATAAAAGRARGEPLDSDYLALMKLAANPKALGAVAGGRPVLRS